MTSAVLLPYLIFSGALAAAPTSAATGMGTGAEGPRFVAVVIGINSYEHLPDPAELNFARSDAVIVQSALRDLAGYQHTFLLTDREANRENIRETLRTQVAQLTGPEDTLLIYFAGHGLGADLGLPTLLASDSTLENGQEDGFEVTAFATDIATWTRAGSTILVTDAIHRNQLDGIPFHGPAADQWPGIGPETLVVSASQAGEPGKDGLFGVVFADALAGAADTNADGDVTAQELEAYLKTRMLDSEQTPKFAGTSKPSMVLAHGVTPGATSASEAPDDAVIYGDHEVYAAKFVFQNGTGSTVTCRDGGTKVCDPSCYVRNFRAGPCTLTTISAGQTHKGVTLALLPGKYDCSLRDDTLTCAPPKLPQTPAKP